MLRKGGNSPLTTLSPEGPDQVPHRVVAVARLVGDLFERTLLDEEGPEYLITAMERLGRLKEESSAEGIVHDLAP